MPKHLCETCFFQSYLCKYKMQALKQSTENGKDPVIKCDKYIKNPTPRNYSLRYCKIMNILDFRYWFCECLYRAPYGRVISADCKRHD